MRADARLGAATLERLALSMAMALERTLAASADLSEIPGLTWEAAVDGVDLPLGRT